jgi:hypothetical protein
MSDQLRVQPLFPAHLLSSDPQARVNYFRQTALISHPEFEKCLASLFEKCAFPTDRNVILLVGPTGVGKSRVQEALKLKLDAAVASNDRRRGQGEAVYQKLRAPAKGSYDFAVMQKEVLSKMGAPLVERTRPVVHRAVGSAAVPTLHHGARSGDLFERGIAQRFFNELISRHPSALLLDEARAIFEVGRPQSQKQRADRLKLPMNFIKDVANLGSCALVLAGANDFLELAVLSGQNARRSHLVHFQPYANTSEGRQGFAIGVLGLLSHLPIAHEINPVTAATEFLVHGFGCVGITAGLLTDALGAALHRNVPMTLDLVRAFYYPAAQALAIRREIEEGKRLAAKFLSTEELLGDDESLNDACNGTAATTSSRRTLKPGETKPSHQQHTAKDW